MLFTGMINNQQTSAISRVTNSITTQILPFPSPRSSPYPLLPSPALLTSNNNSSSTTNAPTNRMYGLFQTATSHMQENLNAKFTKPVIIPRTNLSSNMSYSSSSPYSFEFQSAKSMQERQSSTTKPVITSATNTSSYCIPYLPNQRTYMEVDQGPPPKPISNGTLAPYQTPHLPHQNQGMTISKQNTFTNVNSPLIPMQSEFNTSVGFKNAEGAEISKWNNEKVVSWLSSLGLSKYQQSFRANEITGSDLLELTAVELQTQLGVFNYKHRKTLLEATQKLRSKFPLYEVHFLDKKNQIIYCKEVAQLLSIQSVQKICAFLLELKNYNFSNLFLQQILIKLPMETLEKLESKKESTQDEFLKAILSPSILQTSLRRTIKALPTREVNKYIPPEEICMSLRNQFPLFVHRQLDEVEKEFFSLTPAPSPSYGPSVHDFDTFQHRFNKFTHGRFLQFNWENCLIAGGSVLYCLLPQTDCYFATDKYNWSNPWVNSDIDIFLVGLKSIEFSWKIRQIYLHLLHYHGFSPLVVRTKNCISFVFGYPYRNIQVIFKEHATYADVLRVFDLDCVGVGYAGKDVFILPPAFRAINCSTNFYPSNFVKSDLRTAHITRIVKYFKRGFATMMYDDSTLITSDFATPVLCKVSLIHSFINFESLKISATNDTEGGYDDAYIPYGPTHTIDSIRESMITTLEKYRQTNKVPFFVIGTLDDCLDESTLPPNFTPQFSM